MSALVINVAATNTRLLLIRFSDLGPPQLQVAQHNNMLWLTNRVRVVVPLTHLSITSNAHSYILTGWECKPCLCTCAYMLKQNIVPTSATYLQEISTVYMNTMLHIIIIPLTLYTLHNNKSLNPIYPAGNNIKKKKLCTMQSVTPSINKSSI